MVSMELVGEINTKNPGYVNILPRNAAGSSGAVQRRAESSNEWAQWKHSALYEQLVMEDFSRRETKTHGDRLWITGFSLAGQNGYLNSLDIKNGHIQSVNSKTSKSILWPNESNSVPKSLFAGGTVLDEQEEGLEDALLVSDGFLVPGKDRGGVYVVKNPGHPQLERNICLVGGHMSQTNENDGFWFYHRAVWADLTGDGRKSILTARAKVSMMGDASKDGASNTKTQLVWLEMPKPPKVDKVTGKCLEEDGSPFDPFNERHLPWKSQ